MTRHTASSIAPDAKGFQITARQLSSSPALQLSSSPTRWLQLRAPLLRHTSPPPTEPPSEARWLGGSSSHNFILQVQIRH